MKEIKNILCAVPPTDAGGSTLERAMSLAENNQARLTVVDVLPPAPAGATTLEDGAIPTDLQARIAAERLEALRTLTGEAAHRFDLRHEVLGGSVFLELIRAVLRDGHDLLVKPAEDPNFVARLFGSSDMHLLRKCPCPLWLTKPGEKANYACIVAAVDFDPGRPETIDGELNRRILDLASSLAVSDFAALHVVHVWDAPAEGLIRRWSPHPDTDTQNYVQHEHAHHEQALGLLGDRLRRQLGDEAWDYLSPRFHLRQGDPATVIPEAARRLQADLVVMGTLARAGIAGLLIGNTAESILEQLQCSVLAVKPAGFVSPVKVEAEARRARL